MSRTTTLVAGGGGFLGSHLCDALLETGREVVCVDNFGSGRPENVARLSEHPRGSILEADVRGDPDLPDADEIYHLASRASPADFTEYPVRIALTNTEGTRHLLDHAVDCGARVLYASTSEVYGDPEVHPQPESYTGNVDIRGPRGCYDESKRFGETLTVAYEERYALDVRTVRIFNTYGPRMRVDDGRVVPTFLAQALSGEDLTVYGDGSQTRSFCYVSDLVAGLRVAMDSDALCGDVINLGRENERTIESLAHTILEVCGADGEVVHEPLPEDDPRRRRPDLEKARSVLDWEPTTPLREGLERTAAYIEAELSAR
ncbi:MAG: NAD-dependent epimerase/dehydratase family protein [Halalkalicoccus sp.]